MNNSQAAFQRAVDFVLDHEGGYVWHPSDPGGETKYGISKRAYPHLDIKNLTRGQAIDIYRAHYWNRTPDVWAPVKFLLFDFGVNAGVNRAIRTLQTAIGTTADGIFGPLSQAALDRHPKSLSEFTARRIMYYTSLPTFRTFGLGWTRRTVAAYELSLEL